MADCVNLPKCPFFYGKMSNMPAMTEMYKHAYCQDDNSKCARYLVYRRLGPGRVPSDLFPNDMQGAEQFIAQEEAQATTS